MRFEIFRDGEDQEQLGVVAFQDDKLRVEELTDQTLRERLPGRFDELRITGGYESSPEGDTQVWVTLQRLGREEGLRFERIP